MPQVDLDLETSLSPERVRAALLDFSEIERPSLVHDLNQPVPAPLKGRYGWVIDGGTAEHIFDVRAVLSNIISLTSGRSAVNPKAITTGPAQTTYRDSRDYLRILAADAVMAREQVIRIVLVLDREQLRIIAAPE